MKNNFRLFEKKQPVHFGNVEDARIGELQKRLSLTNHNLLELAEANPAEVLARQEIIQWLLGNQSLMDYPFFRNREKICIEGGSAYSTVPNNGKAFLSYAYYLDNKETYFWDVYEKFRAIDQSLYGLPSRLSKLSNHLDREGQVKYMEEMEIKNSILAELRRIVSVSGLLKFRVGSAKNGIRFKSDLGCYGTWYYHSCIDPDLNPSETATGKLLRKVYLGFIPRKINEYLYEHGKKAAQIKKTPQLIIDDVWSFMKELVGGKNNYSNELKSHLYFLEDCEITVAYQFNETGLNITLIDWEFGSASLAENEVLSPMNYGEARNIGSSLKLNKKINSLLSLRKLKNLDAQTNQWFLKHSETLKIPSHHCDRVFTVLDYEKILGKYQKRIENLRDWQKKILESFHDLHVYYDLAHAVKSINLRFCFPKIVEGNQGVRFDNLYPSRITPTEDKALSPFSELVIDAKIISNMNGKNGSGKSTIMLSGLDAQILAQCGLPVFAHNAQFSLYSHILLSFLDRVSDESTFKAKFKKDMAIMEQIEKIPVEQRHRVLVINDELGSATDHEEALEVMEDYTKLLYKSGVNALISTQITKLGIYLTSERSGCIGQNFLIDKNYQVSLGVGSGRPKEVATEMGFYKMVKKFN